MRDYLGCVNLKELEEKYSKDIIDKSMEIIIMIGFQNLPAYLNAKAIAETIVGAKQKDVDYSETRVYEPDFVFGMNLCLNDIYTVMSTRTEADYNGMIPYVITDDILPYIRKEQKIEQCPKMDLYVQQSDVSDKVWNKLCDELELEPDEINHIGIYKY